MTELYRVELISTDREKNWAYIALCSEKWATNLQLRLDKFETLVGQSFEDGHHDYLKFALPSADVYDCIDDPISKVRYDYKR